MSHTNSPTEFKNKQKSLSIYIKPSVRQRNLNQEMETDLLKVIPRSSITGRTRSAEVRDKAQCSGALVQQGLVFNPQYHKTKQKRTAVS
jgi:hypothetical protein